MEYKVVSNLEEELDLNLDESPLISEYNLAVTTLKKAFESFSIKSSFGGRDIESALVLVDQVNEDPRYILTAELSNKESVNLQTVEFVNDAKNKVSDSFFVLLTFEYNYLGLDFQVLINNNIALFEFNDQISQDMFGIS